jgi:calcineurin-like phosphoesterase family protein
MDEALVANWNRVVSRRDEVWHLGDVGWLTDDSILWRLNGKLHLVVGNHDNDIITTSKRWSSVQDYKRLGSLVMFHYPIWEWDGFFGKTIHLYGHVHNNSSLERPRAINVSVDCHGFTPITEDWIRDTVRNSGEEVPQAL